MDKKVCNDQMVAIFANHGAVFLDALSYPDLLPLQIRCSDCAVEKAIHGSKKAPDSDCLTYTVNFTTLEIRVYKQGGQQLTPEEYKNFLAMRKTNSDSETVN